MTINFPLATPVLSGVSKSRAFIVFCAVLEQGRGLEEMT